MAKDLSTKIMVCPSAWWWHLFRCRGYTERTAKSLMDSFDYEASLVADQSTFDESSWTVTTQFANSDDFLNHVEAELGFDDDNDPSLNGSLGDSLCPKTSFEMSADAKAYFPSALDDPDMDLAASTNKSINTKQYVIAHKSCALFLAMETKRLAQLEFDNREISRRL
jgi:hypothetical protein